MKRSLDLPSKGSSSRVVREGEDLATRENRASVLLGDQRECEASEELSSMRGNGGKERWTDHGQIGSCRLVHQKRLDSVRSTH